MTSFSGVFLAGATTQEGRLTLSDKGVTWAAREPSKKVVDVSAGGGRGGTGGVGGRGARAGSAASRRVGLCGARAAHAICAPRA